MNTKEIFSLALNLQWPWYIKEITLEKEESKLFGRLTIEIDFHKGAKFLMPDGESYTAYDTEKRQWKHLNFFQHECYILARVPRIMDKEGRTRRVEVPWARPGSSFTLLFEAFPEFDTCHF
jgi:hypothetical protein